MLKSFENTSDVEIHIVSPHEFLKRTTEFSIRNINYCFIPYGIPLWHRHWPGFLRFDLYSNLFFLNRKIKKKIGLIHPDLVNLIGSENINYSQAVLTFKHNFPVLVTIQGFISQFKNDLKLTKELGERIKTEEKILRSFKYFCGEQDSSNYISTFNPSHSFFRFYFPVNEELVKSIKFSGKKYDCIFFGNLSKSKGTEDFIKVISILSKDKSDLKACITGGGNASPFKLLAEKLNCEKNIEFTGFLKTQKELFEHVISSRVFLAPPYRERISSTIREAMFLKVPIVAYSTGGIPYINEHDENIYLVETGNYKEMARKTLALLHNEVLREQLAEKAYNYATNEFSLGKNIQRLLSAYNIILKQ
jgi:glycosyltransferase involved in cell wall biosynthesis